MKNYIINLMLIVSLSLMTITGCDDFDDTNVDPKSPTKVDPPYLFTYAQIELADFVATSSVNTNVGRLLAQYWSQTTYTTESRYSLQERELPGALWNNHYRDVLVNLKTARELVPEFETNEAIANNQIAMITVLEVYAYQMLVDVFGNVPYDEALQGRDLKTPSYEDAETIYNDLIERLNNAIANITPSAPGFEGADLYYGGKMSAWFKFANSLKIRLGIRLAEAQPGKAKQLVEEAAPHAFSSNADNATLQYVGGTYANPIYTDIVVSGRTDYVISNTLVDKLNALDDPRRLYYMKPNASGEYVGLEYGKKSGIGGNASSYARLPDLILEETFPGTLMDYAEVELHLAEAAARGWSVGSAESHYYNGIRGSIMKWGLASDVDPMVLQAQFEAYIAQPEVAYSTAAGGNPINAIALQKWIAFYNQGMQGWIEWKRLDYPPLNKPVVDTGEPAIEIPVRFKYPIREVNTNNANRTEAAQAIGGDEYSTRVFWDVN